uniref:VWFA domain-containing protein n=1 Tax=Panagrolaimus sp. PS1159 TaxID=55785 RepID=A0AC35GEI4_9BILA
MNKLLLSLFILVTTFFIFGYGKDATHTQNAIGSDVVIASIRKVQDTCIFPNDLLFLRRLAYVQSKDGNSLKSSNSGKDKSGIWQTTSAMLSEVQKDENHTEIEKHFGIDLNKLSWSNGDLSIPLNDVIVARYYANLQDHNIPLGVNAQADYWVKNFNPSGNTKQFIVAAEDMPKCKPPGMDIIFIVDDSESIDPHDFQNVRTFLTAIINNLKTNQANRIGIVRFNTEAYLELNITYDFVMAHQKAHNLTHAKKLTDIGKGLKMAHQQFKQFGRSNVPMVAVLITDGNGGDANPVADNLKSMGVNLFTVGVGYQATHELFKWSSEPHCMFYYTLKSFDELANSFPELLESQICEVSTKIHATDYCVNGIIDQNQYIFYQIPVDPITGGTIKLHMDDGSAEIYLSQTSRLPSSIDYDFSENSTIEFPAQIFISTEQLHTTENSLSEIHTALVGTSAKSTYRLCNEKGNTIFTTTTSTMAPTTTTASSPPHEQPDVEVHVKINYPQP